MTIYNMNTNKHKFNKCNKPLRLGDGRSAVAYRARGRAVTACRARRGRAAVGSPPPACRARGARRAGGRARAAVRRGRGRRWGGAGGEPERGEAVRRGRGRR
jgi:hypothetical protein